MFSQCLGPRSKTWPQISPDCFIAHWRRKKNCNSNHENNQAAGTANNKNETNSQVIEDFQSQVPKKKNNHQICWSKLPWIMPTRLRSFQFFTRACHTKKSPHRPFNFLLLPRPAAVGSRPAPAIVFSASCNSSVLLGLAWIGLFWVRYVWNLGNSAPGYLFEVVNLTCQAPLPTWVGTSLRGRLEKKLSNPLAQIPCQLVTSIGLWISSLFRLQYPFVPTPKK
jgi:hypothetical protein